MKQFNLFIIIILVFIGFSSGTGAKSEYPDTNWIHVTYFDYHSEGSCPDFNPTYAGATTATKSMVAGELDKDGLPVGATKIYFSKYLNNWFRSSEAGEQPVTNKKPVYDHQTGAFLSESGVVENPYVNIKIEDSLPFIHIGNGTTIPLGTYEYQNKSFFPLDDKGFGKEPTWSWNSSEQRNDHNYSFTMMLVDTFTYREGLTFSFTGDDDVWVFINNKLALDIGGLHSAVTDNINLDALAQNLGLALGEPFEIKFFFAERQATESQVWITSNILGIMPNRLQIDVWPGDTISPGDTLLANAIILTDTGKVSLKDLPGEVVWGFIDPKAYNHDSTFSWERDSAYFRPTKAPTVVYIWATYTDTAGNTLTDTVEIFVVDPWSLDIRALNPVRLSDLSLNSDLINTYNLNRNQGAFVLINFSGTVSIENWNATMDIFDALGNRIAKGVEAKPIQISAQESALTFVWDVRNSQGRLVGSGTYVGLISLLHKKSLYQNHKVFIGVQR